ncbi:hypothetical protein Bealeia1_01159 [Candidatus Bealeia paramacronuclearis]|uniref:Uncharacterized protein n=1 Tax=Candidatus Bealeia paramacronuclearis TaxID=1921001 RepID=A0ABZ2C3D0_9PROT|nr:hypothetical protein [Candidatus Bealeia paramacronuclearis]
MKFFFALSLLVLSFSLPVSAALTCTSCPNNTSAKCSNGAPCPCSTCPAGDSCECIPNLSELKKLTLGAPLPEGTAFRCDKEQKPFYDTQHNLYICPFKPLASPATEAPHPQN